MKPENGWFIVITIAHPGLVFRSVEEPLAGPITSLHPEAVSFALIVDLNATLHEACQAILYFLCRCRYLFCQPCLLWCSAVIDAGRIWELLLTLLFDIT